MSGAEVMVAVSVISATMGAVNVIKGLKEGNLMQAALGGVSAYFAFSGLGASTVLQQAAGQGATGVANPAASLTGKAAEGAASTAGTAGGAGTGITNVMDQGLQGTMSGMDLAGGLADQASGNLAGGSVFGAGDIGSQLGSQGLESATGTMLDQASGLGGDLMGLGEAGLSDFGARAGANSVFGSLGPSTAYQEAQMGLTQGIGDLGQAGAQQAAEQGLLSKAMGFAKENPELLKVGGQMLSGYSKQKQAEELRKKQIKLLEEQRRRQGAAAGRTSQRMGSAADYRR